jgi:hypothetical protein
MNEEKELLDLIAALILEVAFIAFLFRVRLLK